MKRLLLATGLVAGLLLAGCGSVVDGGYPPSPNSASDAGATPGAEGVGSWQRVDRCPVAGCPRTLLSYEVAVWTGERILFWLSDANVVARGESFDPITGAFTAFVGQGAPPTRDGMAITWTGSRLLAWGGLGLDGQVTADGALYDPTNNVWTPLPLDHAPMPSNHALAVATGGEVLVWGWPATAVEPTGGVYRLASSTWKPMAVAGQPTARASFTAVWTGTEMIVWGGGAEERMNTGGRYDLLADAWRQTSTEGAPRPRLHHTAVWTGKEMIVWGGQRNVVAGQSNVLDTGGVYDPVHDTWRPTSLENAPSPREWHHAVWTGHRMLIMGDGRQGGLYDPTTDRWERVTEKGDPGDRFSSTFAAWDEAYARLLVVGEPVMVPDVNTVQVWAYTPPAP